MHRLLLGLSVWLLLVALVSALAALARPDRGPPMPAPSPARPPIEALVPERDVTPGVKTPPPSPDELSGTVAPVSSEPVSSEPDSSKTALSSQLQPATASQHKPASAQGKPASAQDKTAPHDEPTSAQEPLPPGSISDPDLGVLPATIPHEEEGLGVNLVDTAGSPIGGATVRYALQKDLDRLRDEGVDVDALDPSDLLERSERTATTNATGFAITDSAAGTMIVDARRGDLYAWTRIDRGVTSFVRLEMLPDTTLAVETVDRGGRPVAGVGVLLRAADGTTVWSARTAAPEGRALLRHADGAIAAARVRGVALHVSLDSPGAAEVELGLAKVPKEPVRLTAEPGALVRVRVEDFDGAACRTGSVRMERVGLAPGRTWCERTLADGVALFDGVPLGANLQVRVRDECGPDALLREIGSPAAAGEQRELVLRHEARMPRLAGRCVGATASPWREFEVTAWVARPGPSGTTWEAQGRAPSDQAGAFVVDVPGWHAAGKPLALVLVAKNPWGRTVASAPIELAPPAPAETRDLGAVTALDWKVLTAGVVQDERGLRLDDCEVMLCTGTAHTPDLRTPDPRTRVVTDGYGAFMLRGPAPEGQELTILVTEPGPLGASVRTNAKVGDRKVNVLVATTGKLTGRVLLPAGAPRDALMVYAESERGLQSTATDEQGAFELGALTPGTHALRLRAPGFPKSDRVLAGIEVPRGATSSDARLAAIDARDAYRVLEVELVGPGDRPIPRARLGPPEGPVEDGRPLETANGVLRALVPADLTEVLVAADGYVSARVSVVDGRSRAVLAPAGG